jgi:hypothetical protein
MGIRPGLFVAHKDYLVPPPLGFGPGWSMAHRDHPTSAPVMKCDASIHVSKLYNTYVLHPSKEMDFPIIKVGSLSQCNYRHSSYPTLTLPHKSHALLLKSFLEAARKHI